MDTELKELLLSMQSDMKTMQSDMKTMQDDIKTMRSDMKTMQNGMESMQDDIRGINQRTERVEILLETDVPKQIKTLAEGHRDILDRLPEAEEIDTLRNRVRTLERVVTGHTNEINDLKKAN